MNPLVTVIVPVYKASEYIERCATSLLRQTYDNIEYYFVNDCTPDNSIELLEAKIEEFPSRKPTVTIINFEQNQGHAHARNVALKQCNGEYVIQIDADDWVENTMVEKLVESAVENDSDIVCSEFIWEMADGNVYYHVDEKDITREGLKDFKWILQYSAHWNKLVRTSLIKDSGVYCIEGTNNWVDVGQIARLRFIANKISVVHEGLYHYNFMNINSVSRSISDKRLNDMITVANVVSEFVEKQFGKQYDLSVQYLKFLSISPMLNPQREEYRRWLNTFPEAKKHIFKYPIRPFSKFFYWLAAHHIYFPLRLIKRFIAKRKKAVYSVS